MDLTGSGLHSSWPVPRRSYQEAAQRNNWDKEVDQMKLLHYTAVQHHSRLLFFLPLCKCQHLLQYLFMDIMCSFILNKSLHFHEHNVEKINRCRSYMHQMKYHKGKGSNMQIGWLFESVRWKNHDCWHVKWIHFASTSISSGPRLVKSHAQKCSHVFWEYVAEDISQGICEHSLTA